MESPTQTDMDKVTLSTVQVLGAIEQAKEFAYRQGFNAGVEEAAKRLELTLGMEGGICATAIRALKQANKG